MQIKDGNEVAYAYMRELYKLVLNIRDYGGTMLESAYSYFYIPSTISNFDDSTVQQVFWLERLGVTEGDDELTYEEQNKTRTKGIDTEWQNLEYDEYEECIYDVGNSEDAKVYALFPFGAPIIRSYYMLRNWDDLITNGYSASHPAVDMYSRAFAKDILNRGSDAGKLLYYYELNRLTTVYMENGNSKQDAFTLAEKSLNSKLEGYALNSPVVAIAPGKVTGVGYNARSGFYVIIRHNDEDSENVIKSEYVHLKRWPTVDTGEIVGAGTIIGYEGTTGRSTGNHLHFRLTVNGQAVNPKTRITPVFSPFYYDKKAKKVLEEDEEKAFASEYYDLERTILPETALFNKYNIINGMKLKNGTTINYTAPTNKTNPYKAGNAYQGSSYGAAIWGNNVPSEPIAESLDDIIDLDLLNENVEFKESSTTDANGKNLTYKENKEIVANPAFFFADEKDFKKRHTNFEVENAFDDNGMHVRLKMPTWYAVDLSGYRSDLEVPYYNGPESVNDALESEEAINDLKAMQDALRQLGYYSRAGVDFDEAGYGIYTEQFEKVVRAMQRDLVEKGFGVYDIEINGKLDIKTVSAYNTMVHYVTAENQYAMAQKTAYNAGVDLSLEPALIWAIIATEGDDGNRDELALKESGDASAFVSIEYRDYKKNCGRDQGLMQIKPGIGVQRYAEKKVDKEDAVMYIRRPMQNTVMGAEIFKEYMQYFMDNYDKTIDKYKNEIIFGRKTSGYWYNVYATGTYYQYRWVDYENIDRVMLYALALTAYDNHNRYMVDVKDILENGPTGYAEEALGRFLGYILDEKEGTGVSTAESIVETSPNEPTTPSTDDTDLAMPPSGDSSAVPPLTDEEFAILLAVLNEQLGKPYVRAAAGPDAFDCSGLVLYAYSTATNLRYVGYHTASYMFSYDCVIVDSADMQPGDLLFYYSAENGIEHVAIYIGNGEIIHASTPSTGVIKGSVGGHTYVARLKR